MTKEERYQAFISHFAQSQPNATIELKYKTPFQLLIAVVLSAQCTDKRINRVTPPLFETFPTPQHMAKGSYEEVFAYIKSVSYPNSKTKYLITLSKMLIEDFAGEIPAQAEELQKLPGVGRKTAHVLVSVLHNQPKMAVDTHVMRVSKRLGLVDSSRSTPLAIERQLVHYLPKKYIARAHHWLILHGRYVCVARSPKCGACALASFCAHYQQTKAVTLA